MPISSAIAKSVSESPPRTASAPRMNIAPRPVFTVRGMVCRIAEFTDLREAQPALRAPQLAHPVEHDDRVVDRVADHGEQRGEEDAVDRLAEPGEDADQHEHVVRHRGDRRGAERPAEPDRQVGQLRQQRDAQRDQRLAGAARRRGSGRSARRAACSTSPPDASARAAWISASSSLVISPVRTEMLSSPLSCTTARGKPASDDGLAGVVDRQRGRRGVLHEPAAGELHAEVEPAADDAGHREEQHDERAGQPAPAVPHQVRVALVEPGADPAGRRDAGDGRAVDDEAAGGPPSRRAPG